MKLQNVIGTNVFMMHRETMPIKGLPTDTASFHLYESRGILCAIGRDSTNGTYFCSLDINSDHDFTNDYRYTFTRHQIEDARNFIPQRYADIWVSPKIYINGVARGNTTYTILHAFDDFVPMLSVHDFCTGKFFHNGKTYYICSAYDRSEFAIIDSMPSNNDALARALLDKNLLTEVQFPVIRDSLIFRFLDLNYANQQCRLSITLLKENTKPVFPFVGFRAPNFASKDLKGKTIKLGKGYTLLDFWGSWCNPCIALVPHLVEIHEQYPALKIISIANERDKMTMPKLKELISELNMNWTHACELLNDSTNMANRYNVSSYPTIFIIDPSGNVVFRGAGSNDTEKLKKTLKEIFKDE
ncbi:MAG: TlpA family protein disulfide reductase [Bacteroidaceae bacterium]|nr:TlpA family protein disulfide reductase [Bacteroidaceae bacterium]